MLVFSFWRTQADDLNKNTDSNGIIQIPGELTEDNNVVFSQDGHIGLVATYNEQNGEAGHSLYSFDAETGRLISRLSTSPSGINPTKLQLVGNLLVVSTRANIENEAAFLIVPVQNDGSFRTGMAGVATTDSVQLVRLD